MNTDLVEIDETVHTIRQVLASRPYYPCVLFVHHDGQVLAHAGARLVADTDWVALSLGAFLAGQLLAVAPSQRSREAERILTERIAELQPGPLICDDVDFLFEPTLNLDPLALFRQCSRRTPLVVLWPGTYQGVALTYAAPNHTHYRVWKRTELCDRCILVGRFAKSPMPQS